MTDGPRAFVLCQSSDVRGGLAVRQGRDAAQDEFEALRREYGELPDAAAKGKNAFH